jgi:predicted transcriptional regulator
MIKNYSNKINQRDKKAIRLFTGIGFQKNFAKTLIYISKNGGCRSIEIEQETNQRQPEVSSAMQELLRKGWITKKDYRKKRKGRPVQIYKLAYPLNEIITEIEIEKNKEIDNLKKDFFKLKNLILKNNNN